MEAAVIARATTTVEILRGTVDDYTGQITDELIVLEGAPASLIELAQNVQERDQATPRTVRTATLRMKGGTDLRRDDRVRDASDTVWAVVSVRQPGNSVTTLDLTAELSRTTA